MSAIEVRDATKTYGDVTALDGLALTVDRGSRTGLLGSNGAGKSTLFAVLVGLEAVDSGEVTVLGRDPADGTAVRERVGYLPERADFPASATAREVLSFHARMRGVPTETRGDRVAAVLENVGLADAADRAVGGFSNGMTRRLGLGTAVVADPQVLILDEPTAGLDPLGIDAFHAAVERATAGREVTVLVSSHALAEVERLCEDVAVVHEGRVVTRGHASDLVRDAADAVTVDATLDGPESARSAADRLGSRSDVTAVHRSGARLSVDCVPGAAYDVVATLHEGWSVERFEVREPGLETVVREAIGGVPA